MKKIRLHKPIALAALFSISFALIGPSLAQAADTLPRKSEWTEQTSPQDEIIQIPQRSNDEGTKAPIPDRSPYADDRIIVKYKPGYQSPASSLLASDHLNRRSPLTGAGDAEVLQLKAPANAGQLVAELNEDPHVLYAELDRKLYPASIPDDPYFPDQWGLRNTGQTAEFNYNDPYIQGHPGVVGLDIQAPEAWDITQGSGDVVVAVIDTGIPTDHPDLKDSIWTNDGEIPGNGKDDDGNGYIDDVNGWNFVDEDNKLYDPIDAVLGDTHGAGIAGIIAAKTNNGTGVAGIAPNVKIMPLKFIEGNYGYESDLIEAIAYAERNGARIANISAESYEPGQALKDAIDASGMLIVASAGNEGVDTDSTPSYPASYDSPNILSVTAIDNEGQLAYRANTGFESVDVAAPGEAIRTAYPVMNPGLGAQIDNGVYKVIFNGIGFEYMLDEEDADADYRQEAFDKAMDFLGASKYDAGAKILLVQDDLSNMSPIASSSRLSVHKALLEDYAGFHEETDIVQSAPNGGDGPTAEMMESYDVVIWFTGMADRLNVSNLTKNDQQQLTDYLNEGGHLLLTGGNVLNGRNSITSEQPSSITETPFVRDMLHLYFVEQYSYGYAAGAPGTIYEYAKYPLDEERDSYNWLITRDPSITKINLEYIEDEPDSTYSFMRGTSVAAAHASGVAALVLSQEPSLGATALKQRVAGSGKRLSSLNGRVASGKLINAYMALSDDEIPGSPFPGGSVTNGLDAAADRNDVYATELHAGENVKITLTGDEKTDFDLYLYSPDAKTVNLNVDMAAYSENENTSSESIDFTVTASGTYYLDVYAYEGSGGYTLSVESASHSGRYEDTDESFAFTGQWKTLRGGDYSGQTAKRINGAGKAELAFTGTYVSWIGSRDKDQGLADVYIDGVKVASPSLYAESESNQQLIFEKIVPYGKHTIAVEWTGKRDPAAKKAGGAFINVDAFEVKHLVQEDESSVTFGGPWFTNYSVKQLGGKAKYTNAAGSYVEFEFEGTGISLLAYTGADRGKANVYLDGVLASDEPIDLYSDETVYRAKVFEAANLSPGAHTLRIDCLGEKSAASGGSYISVDAIAVMP